MHIEILIVFFFLTQMIADHPHALNLAFGGHSKLCISKQCTVDILKQTKERD